MKYYIGKRRVKKSVWCRAKKSSHQRRTHVFSDIYRYYPGKHWIGSPLAPLTEAEKNYFSQKIEIIDDRSEWNIHKYNKCFQFFKTRNIIAIRKDLIKEDL